MSPVRAHIYVLCCTYECKYALEGYRFLAACIMDSPWGATWGIVLMEFRERMKGRRNKTRDTSFF